MSVGRPVDIVCTCCMKKVGGRGGTPLTLSARLKYPGEGGCGVGEGEGPPMDNDAERMDGSAVPRLCVNVRPDIAPVAVADGP